MFNIHEALPKIDRLLISDDLRSQAYNQIKAEDRAGIKDYIAKLHTFFSSSLEGSLKGSFKFEYEAFFHNQIKDIAPYAFFFVPHAFKNYQGLLSAIMPALKAKVRYPFIFFVKENYGKTDESLAPNFLDPTLLTSLDLMGMDLAYAVSREDYFSLQSFVGDLVAPLDSLNYKDRSLQRGRFVFFGTLPVWSELALKANSQQIPSLFLPDKAGADLWSNLTCSWFMNSYSTFEDLS